MTIPINMPLVGREEISAVVSVLKDGSLTSSASRGGRHVRTFEERARSFVRSRYVVAVNSGTAALQAALYALGIKHGDEVLIPSFTFVATANAVVSTGARPVFADILRGSHTVDPDDLEKKITKRTRAMIPVHLYGSVADVERIGELSEKHQIPVIEDAAQSLGSTYRRRHSGTFFDMGCYSMYPAKVMTSAEGGFITTGSKALRDRLLMIRNHGMLRGYDTRILGLNLRLSEIGAAMASVQIRRLPEFLKRRRDNAALLSELLSDAGAELPGERRHERVNWYLYTITVDRRDRIMRALNRKGIGAVPYYPTPVHKTPFYESGTHLPNTDLASSRVLSLPVHPGVRPKDVRFIAEALKGML